MIWPRIEQQWFFPYPDYPEPRSEDLALEGWPAETLQTQYWHYTGCYSGNWVSARGIPVFRCTQLLEQRVVETEQVRRVDLTYSN